MHCSVHPPLVFPFSCASPAVLGSVSLTLAWFCIAVLFARPCAAALPFPSPPLCFLLGSLLSRPFCYAVGCIATLRLGLCALSLSHYCHLFQLRSPTLVISAQLLHPMTAPFLLSAIPAGRVGPVKVFWSNNYQSPIVPIMCQNPPLQPS
jgi:hypothetical protein